MAVFENRGRWDKSRHKNSHYSMYCIASQCNIFENAEKLPEETARQEWSGMTEFSLKTIGKAGG